MPGFTDWWDILGTGVQSIFAWTTFNRDAFADNVGWRQNQKYQQKNYHISWISVARDDIRDMMSISVNRLNNFMIVNGLVLGVAGSAITSANFNTKASHFLVAAFLVSIASSIVFLVLAIMFGIKGQNCAFTNTMKLLTWEMRPENPADYNHDYMSQAQWIEKNGLLQMFRVPGMMPDYKTDPKEDEHMLSDHMKKLKAESGHTYAGAKGSQPGASSKALPAQRKNRHEYGTDLVAEDFTALEHLEVSSTSLWYLTKFGYFMKLWMPYDTHCKYSMGMGMLALGHAGAYFTMGTILSGGWDVPWYAGVGASFSFVYMVALVIQQNFKEQHGLVKVASTALLCLGPTLGVYASTTKVNLLNKWLWSFCFFFHFLFWTVTYFATNSKKILRPSRLGAVGSKGGFWGRHEEEHYSKHTGKSGKHDSNISGANPPAQAVAPPAGNTPAVVGNADRLARRVVGDRPGDWSDWEDSGSDTDGSDGSTTVPANNRSAAYRVDNGAAASASKSSSAAPEKEWDHNLGGSHDKVIAGAGRWPTDDNRFEDKVSATNASVKTALQQTIIVIAAVWFTLLVWVITTAFVIDEESPVYRTYAGEEVMPVTWPSPFFRPTRVSCAEASSSLYQFLSDDYRIFRLTDAGGVAEELCELNTTIRDLSTYCDGSCRPIVLTASNQIIDCRTGIAERLLQESREAVLLSVYMMAPGKPLRDQKLVISLGEGRSVLYQWSKLRDGWVPEFELTKAGEGMGQPVAIDISGNHLVEFYGAEADRLTVYRRDLSNMMLVGGGLALSSAAAPLQHGCAFDMGQKAMVLPELHSQRSSPTVLRLDFQKTHGASTFSR